MVDMLKFGGINLTNEVMKAILERRSIRKYKPDSLARADIETILSAGINAPNGADTEPWHFTILLDKKTIDDLDDKARSAMRDSGIERIMVMGNNPNYKIFFHAPVVIIISGEKILRKPGTHLSALADCSAAIQNMQLAAHSLGLGTCWVGLIRYLFSKDESFAPEGYQPLFALTLGYPANPPTVIHSRPRREGTISWIESK